MGRVYRQQKREYHIGEMMTEKRYEAYYDKYMEDWKVQDILTLDILPCVSEKVAKEFANRLNNSYCANMKLLKSNDFLLKEIEQLKKENKELKKENEQLKEEIKSLTSNLEEDYILVKRNKNAKPTKYCSECWNYETETEEVIAFGDYETLTKISCREGHHILDNTDATDCPDYEPKKY